MAVHQLGLARRRLLQRAEELLAVHGQALLDGLAEGCAGGAGRRVDERANARVRSNTLPVSGGVQYGSLPPAAVMPAPTASCTALSAVGKSAGGWSHGPAMSEMADPMRLGERVAIQYAYRPEYTSSSGTACRRRRPAWPDEMKAFVSRSTSYTHGSNGNTLLDPALRWRLSVGA